MCPVEITDWVRKYILQIDKKPKKILKAEIFMKQNVLTFESIDTFPITCIRSMIFDQDILYKKKTNTKTHQHKAYSNISNFRYIQPTYAFKHSRHVDNLSSLQHYGVKLW